MPERVCERPAGRYFGTVHYEKTQAEKECETSSKNKKTG